VFNGDKLRIEASAQYHYGAPVKGQPANYSVYSFADYDLEIPGLNGFSFINTMVDQQMESDYFYDEYYEPSDKILASGDKTLDDNGLFSFDFTIEPETSPRPRNLGITVRAYDVDSRVISKYAQILAHPASLYAALKPLSYFAAAGYPQSFDLAAASPDGVLHPTEVSLTLYRRNWTTVRKRGPGAVYLFSSKAFDEVIEEKVVNTQDSPVQFEFTPPKAGYYWVKASLKDPGGNLNESSVSFYTLGTEAVGWRYPNDDNLTIVADKNSYAPGDTAKILIQSPFQQGQALVTVERASIRQSYVTEITNNSPVFEIPLKEDDGPNVFVSVILSRGRIAEKPDKNNVDLGKPTIRKGYITLNIPSNKDVLNVKVETQKPTYRPGEEVTINLQVTDRDSKPISEAEVAVVVVDTALIQLSNSDGYFPDTLFQAKRLLSVVTVNPINSLIGRENWNIKGGAEAGGGGDMSSADLMAAQGLLSNQLRTNFKNLAFFKPDLLLSPDGRGQVSFKLPDNLTTFKIYAVATGHGRLSGTGQSEILVTKDLLLRSSLPAYASVGDEFMASVILTNRSQNAGQAVVSLSAENLELVSDTQFQIELKPGENKEVFFPVAASATGSAFLTFTVNMGQDSDQALFEIPVLPATPLTTQASYRLIEPGETQIDLGLSEGIDLDRSSLSVTVSPSLLGVLAAPFQWLSQYPYNCLEQLTSKAFGSLIELRLKNRLQLTEERQKIASDNVNKHISYLIRTNIYGGFTPWPSMTYWQQRSPILTAYVLEFLLSAKEDGFDVSSEQLDSITSYLMQQLNDDSNNLPHINPNIASSQLYVTYVLTRAGAPTSSYVEIFFSKVSELKLIDLLHLARAVYYLPKSASRTEMLYKTVTLILNHLDISAGEARISNLTPAPYLWCDTDKLTALTFLVLSESAPYNEFMPYLARDLANRAKKGHFSSTQSNVTALLAYDAYVKTLEPQAPNLDVKVSLDQTEIAGASFKSFLDASLSVESGLAAKPKTALISAQGTGQLWSAVKLTSAPLVPNLDPEISANLVLSRSYSVVEPEISTPDQLIFKRGQVLKVTVTMMTPEDRYNLVLEDRIPAGFEPLNFNLATEDQTLIGKLKQNSNWSYSDNHWYQYQEIWPERVAVFASYLPAGVYTFSYLVRPVTLGTYSIYGPQAEEMYSAETFARGQGHKIVVAPQ
jgi:uncharacterized protein YfaS (alpha-2-macroglobulin family)